MQNNITKHTTLTQWIMALAFIVFSCMQVNAQTSDTLINNRYFKQSTRTLVAFFMNDSTELITPGELISKTIILLNLEGKERKLRVSVSAPPEWKRTSFSDRLYTIKGGEELYLPVSIIPQGKIKGNTKYLITVYVSEESGNVIGTSSFFAYRKRTSSWDINLLNPGKIYFKNKQNTADLNFGVFNMGNEEQPLSIFIENNKSKLTLTDTIGRIKNNTYTDINLPVGGDTLFNYKVNAVEGLRNQRFVDTESHRAISSDETKNYTIYIKTSESKNLGNKAQQKNKKVDFVKLGNEVKVTPFGYAYFPLTLDANINSIANGSPLLNVLLRGNTQLDNGANLLYQFQTNFSTNYYSDNYLRYSNFVVGVYDKKYAILAGDISGVPENNATFAVPGRGVGAMYRIGTKQSIGAFYTKNPLNLLGGVNNLGYSTEGYGFSYNVKLKTTSISTGYTRSNQISSKFITDYYGLNVSQSLFKRHSLSGGLILANHLPNLGQSVTGFIARANYSATYLKNNALSTNLTFGYFSKRSSYTNNGEVYIGTSSISYRLSDRYSFQGISNLNKRTDVFINIPGFIPTSYFDLNNQLTLNRSFGDGRFISTGAYYNFSEIASRAVHTRGISTNFGSFDYDKNQLFSASVIAGYTRPTFYTPSRDYFFLQFFGMARMKVFSANIRYAYGNIGTSGYGNGGLIYSPQIVSSSLNHQHQFKDQHFILQQFISYTYYSLNERQTLSYMPELNYYTNNDWRFRLQIGYYLTRNSSSNVFYNPGGATGITQENTVVSSQNVMANLGVRKTFGVKNPFSKSQYCSANFIAFIDVNGNHLKDNDEYLLENVVIRVNGWDVLTNEKGKAKLQNMPAGLYEFGAFSLEELDGYFPNIADTILIARNYLDKEYIAVPFVKGVKIYGKINVDKDLLSNQIEFVPELGGIKISAENVKTVHTLTENDGSFMFYAPYGNYKIIFDEKVLGTRYTLLQNNIQVQIDKDVESVFVTFNLVEKRRKVSVKRYDANGKEIKSGETNSIPNTAVATRPAPATNLLRPAQPAITDKVLDAFLRNKVDVVNQKGLIYTVQLGAFRKPLNPKAFNGVSNIMFEVIDENFVRILSGKFTNEESCIATLRYLSSKGFNDAFISAYYNGRRLTLQEANQLKNAGVR